MKFDPRQARAMRNIGFPEREIALRLGVSARHVRRIVQDMKDSPVIQDILEIENILWNGYYKATRNYSRVAWLFGVTRQAVWQHLNQQQENVT